jgi:DNA excision repair protein ERCC-2
VYTLEDLQEYERKQRVCPYFYARQLILRANVVIFSYQYMMDPKISELVTKNLSANAVVVFDEAHNIDKVALDVLSINLTRRTLEASSRNLRNLTTILNELGSFRCCLLCVCVGVGVCVYVSV